MERREALIEAGRVRLRPILMTTFALIAGMIPVALGSGEGGDFRAPLGIAVIGGVITSTLLTLLVIPTVYEMLADTRDWLGARCPRENGVRTAGPQARVSRPASIRLGSRTWTGAVDSRSPCTTRSFPKRSKAGASCT